MSKKKEQSIKAQKEKAVDARGGLKSENEAVFESGMVSDGESEFESEMFGNNEMPENEMMSENIDDSVQRPKANREYKDTVFRMLFSDKKKLLELYNGMTQGNHTDENELEIVTLKNAVYMGIKNDLSFLIDMGLYLYEHQSTVNPNIPLRDLAYISEEYSKFVEGKSLYSSALTKIPTPYFVVFYNGTTRQEDCIEYKLSDAFFNKVEDPALELKVKVLNINEGHNAKLMENCRTLKEYSIYVARVRKYANEMSLNEAVDRAVDECITEGVLEEFLRQNRAEVVMTSIFEYDKEYEEKKLRKAEYEYGVEVGEARGIQIGETRGINALIDALSELGVSSDVIMSQLMSRFSLTEEQAKKYLWEWKQETIEERDFILRKTCWNK